jgi:hypothetical protein
VNRSSGILSAQEPCSKHLRSLGLRFNPVTSGRRSTRGEIGSLPAFDAELYRFDGQLHSRDMNFRSLERVLNRLYTRLCSNDSYLRTFHAQLSKSGRPLRIADARNIATGPRNRTQTAGESSYSGE